MDLKNNKGGERKRTRCKDQRALGHLEKKGRTCHREERKKTNTRGKAFMFDPGENGAKCIVTGEGG